MFESIKNFLHRIFIGVPAIYDCSDEVYWDDDWVYTEIYNCSYTSFGNLNMLLYV